MPVIQEQIQEAVERLRHVDPRTFAGLARDLISQMQSLDQRTSALGMVAQDVTELNTKIRPLEPWLQGISDEVAAMHNLHLGLRADLKV